MSAQNMVRAVREFWRRPSSAYIMMMVCAVYEAVQFTRLVLVPSLAVQVLGAGVHVWWGLPIFALGMVVSIIALWPRRSHPIAVLCVESLLQLVFAVLYGSEYVYIIPPWFVAFYVFVVEIDGRFHSMVGVAVGIIAVASLCGGAIISGVWRGASVSNLFNSALSLLSLMFIVLICANLSRHQREREAGAKKLEHERIRSEQLAGERDEAMHLSRVAAELHDSVGHDLTAIIALSEGLSGSTGSQESDDAVAMINDLAREGLADTRTAVHALQVKPADGSDGVGVAVTDGHQGESRVFSGIGTLHTWDDIRLILEHARASGIVVPFTETGRRPEDGAQADLCFTITREAVTNAMRHGNAVSRIVVSWDHGSDGSLTLTVRDDGKVHAEHGGNGDGAALDEALQPEGSGLKRIKDCVEAVGGCFEAGPAFDADSGLDVGPDVTASADGWTVKTFLPPLVGQWPGRSAT